MAYCTFTEVIGTGGILTGIGTNTVGSTAVGLHITRADNIINGNLSIFGAPFGPANIPPIVKTVSIDISGHFVMRTLFTQESQNKSEWTGTLYSNAMKILGELVNGKMLLLDSTGAVIEMTEIEAESDIKSNTEGYSPTFAEDIEVNQTLDSDKLDDIASERE